jgi:RHS repeat-associated protein
MATLVRTTAQAQSYDPENRLTSVSGMQTDGYTGDGLRAWKQPYGGSRTYFLYDGEFPVVELNSAGSVTAVTTSGANGVVSRRSGGASVFYAFDDTGDVSERLASDGTVLTQQTVTYAGARVGTDQSSDGEGYFQSQDPFSGYRGQWGYYTDNETQQVLLTHRYYSLSTEQFTTRDPMGYDGGINLYEYCGNDPVNKYDETGFAPLSCSTSKRKKPHPKPPCKPPFQCGKTATIGVKAGGGPVGVSVGINGSVTFDVASYWCSMPLADRAKIHTCAELYKYMLSHLTTRFR